MAPFYGWGSTALRLEPLQGGSLETNKVPKTTVPSSVCVLNQIGVLLRKPNQIPVLHHYGGQEWKNGDKNNVSSRGNSGHTRHQPEN